MSKFKTVKKGEHRLYCGPTAICLVTGRKGDVVIKTILADRKHNRVRQGGKLTPERRRFESVVVGMYLSEVLRICRLLGKRPVQIDNWEFRDDQQMTVAQYAKSLRAARDNRLRIVELRGHFVTMTARQIADNHDSTPHPHSGAKWQRSRVLASATFN